MNQKEIKQELYIKEWEQLYSRQQESGMSIDAFCKANNISRNKFFYWQRKARAVACKDVVVPVDATNEVTKPATNNNPVFTAVNLSHETTGGISIRTGNTQINISPDANTEHVRMVLEVMSHA